MAAAENTCAEASSPLPECDEPKGKALEKLMESIRAKADQYKPWNEIIKSFKTAMTEKRSSNETSNWLALRKFLDVVQPSIKVTSLQSMVERLESIARKLPGMQFSGTPMNEFFISAGMFYVEIKLEDSGEVEAVRIHYHNSDQPTESPLLREIVRARNFAEFSKHLEGLASLYINTGEDEDKVRAFKCHEALEMDIKKLAEIQNSLELADTVNKAPVGYFQQRKEGRLLKLTYFVAPYDLLDTKTKSSVSLTVDAINEKGRGHSVTVCIEGSSFHKLQTTTLVSICKTPDGKSRPSFAAHSNLNSTALPARFYLKLCKPIPISIALVEKIKAVTSIDFDVTCTESLLSLIVNDESDGKLSINGPGLHVTLPDQEHCYYIKSNSDLQGIMLSAIPFTHPNSVPQILEVLRQQVLFNTVVGSCIRPQSKKDAKTFIFEASVYSTSRIIISFEHPLEESIATVDLDLREISNIECKIYTLKNDDSIATDEFASKVMQRSLSIPITMRALIKKAQSQRDLFRSSNQNDMNCATSTTGGSVPYLSEIPHCASNISNTSPFPSGDFSNIASRMCSSIKKEAAAVESFTEISSTLPGSISVKTEPVDDYGEPSYGEHPEEHQKSENFGAQGHFQKNISLINLDGPGSKSSSFPFTAQSDSSSSSKSRKRKRRGTIDNNSPTNTVGKSPKYKLSEDEFPRTPSSEMSNSPAELNRSSSLPAILLPSPKDQLFRHSIDSNDSLIKSELSSSFLGSDSYIAQEFHSQQSLKMSDSRLSLNESELSNRSDSLSQLKSQYFSENVYDFNKECLSQAESNYIPPYSDIKIKNDNSCHSDQSSKSKFSERKTSDGSMSEGSDSSQKSFSEGEGNSNMTKSKQSSGYTSQPIIISTNLKISKSSNSHKVSKSESKKRQKEAKRSGDGFETTKKKGDKESRQHSTDGDACKSLRSFRMNVNTSMCPPPSDMTIGSPLEFQPVSSPVSLITSIPSKSSIPSKKSSEAKMSGLKSPSPDKSVKPSPPHSSSGVKVEDLDSESKKMVRPTMVKLQSKLNKNSSGGSPSYSIGHASSSKLKSPTLKLKNYNLPSSVTITPIISKATIVSPSRVGIPPDSGSKQTTIESLHEKSESSSSKSNKSLSHSKGSLSAVINKLHVSASNAQHLSNESLHAKSVDANWPDSLIEKKEPNFDRKDTESKSKYSSSDQFTVKQSSQGIKLTVTKTRTGNSSSKSNKSKQSMKSSSSPDVSTIAGNSEKVNTPASSPSARKSPMPTVVVPTTSVPTKIPNLVSSQQKSGSSAQKINVPSVLLSRTANVPKPLKLSPSHTKSGPLSTKVFDKSKSVSKSPKPTSEGKSKVVSSLIAPGSSNVAFAAPISKSDISKMQFSGNTPKTSESVSMQQIARFSPSRKVSADETDERMIRLFVAQPKNETSEVDMPVEYSRKKLDIDDKRQNVSSSSDAKPNIQMQPYAASTQEMNMNDMSFMNEFMPKRSNPCEVSSSSKQDDTSEAAAKVVKQPIIIFPNPVKQAKQDSSPDDSGSIDYPDTPAQHISPDKKIASYNPYASAVPSDKSAKLEVSPSTYLLRSPYSIDGELMDEALMPLKE